MSDNGLKVVFDRRDIFGNTGYEELCVVSIKEVRDRRNTDEKERERERERESELRGVV